LGVLKSGIFFILGLDNFRKSEPKWFARRAEDSRGHDLPACSSLWPAMRVPRFGSSRARNKPRLFALDWRVCQHGGPIRVPGCPMKNFPDAAFEPEMIEAMTAALDRAVASLPEPVSTSHVNLLAESILRTAQAGERDVATLERIALLELQVTPRT
jgi:hypothetical protein